tara:strand:- start:17155 stop:18141 length:987 start_codon:yes stop_codon:yes gene_type:complete
MKKNYFISGGTGSFAKKFAELIIKKGEAKKIIIFSRDEYKQMMMKELSFVKKNLKIFRFYIGDVRDKNRLQWAINNDIDVVIHSAALKQVPTTEYNPFETVQTNIIGTQNIIEVCINKKIDKTILVSTDKAVSPLNLYGSTKLTAEKLFISANLFKGKSKSKFSVVRYGNVMGSRGSVIPILLRQNRQNKNFTVTDKHMTRFNITLDQAVKFVNNCIQKMKGQEIFIPKCSSYRILDLTSAINKNRKINFIGIRKGEKIHEELVNSSEFNYSEENKNSFILYPLKSIKIKKNKKVNNLSSYNSLNNKTFLKLDEIKKLILKNTSDFEK